MSALEDKFFSYWEENHPDCLPERQYRFHPSRLFRFDFAWPSVKMALEIDGFGSGGRAGRHQTISGLKSQADKTNLAASLGWVVLHANNPHLQNSESLDDLAEILFLTAEQRQWVRDGRK